MAYKMQTAVPEPSTSTTSPTTVLDLYGINERHVLAVRSPMPDGPPSGRAWRTVHSVDVQTAGIITAMSAMACWNKRGRHRPTDRRTDRRPQATRHARRNAHCLGRRIRSHGAHEDNNGRPRAQRLRLHLLDGGWRRERRPDLRRHRRDSARRRSTDEMDFHDLHATILHTLGLDHRKLTYPLRRPRLSADRYRGPGRAGDSWPEGPRSLQDRLKPFSPQ